MLLRILKNALRGAERTTKKDSPVSTATDEAARPPQPDGIDLDALIEHCARLVTDQLTPDVEQRMLTAAGRFSAAASDKRSSLNVFVFHVDMGDTGQLKYRDVTMDTGRFDYRAVLDAFVASVARHAPEARIYLATNPGSPLAALAGERVSVVALDVARDQPMYERVNAMCAYAYSAAFNVDTLFLDSDAFMNAAFEPYLEADYDIAVTVRDIPGLMAVNEGVLVARSARPDAAQLFFRRYLATYEALRRDQRVQDYYGDIRKWRGGQLTLNAITRDAAPYSAYRHITVGGVVLKVLPCDPFNYSYAYDEGMSVDELQNKVIVHLKGGRKSSLDVWLQASQLKNGKTVSGPASNNARPSADRRYSLDTTPPLDYEPVGTLDYETATLTAIADFFKTDKGTIKHAYTDIYARYLEPLRHKSVRLLEIGVACGSSLKMWSKYLGTSSKIVGVDIRQECASLCQNYDNIKIMIADAASTTIPGPFDVIVDDGSHVSEDIVKTWNRLWPALSPGGYYIVEDMRCTHDSNYQKNFTFPKHPSAFDRKHIMAWLDALMKEMDFGRSDVDFIHLYRELAILRKKGP